jgi:hypothetical protein
MCEWHCCPNGILALGGEHSSGCLNARMRQEFLRIKCLECAVWYVALKCGVYELKVVDACLKLWCAQPRQLHPLAEELFLGRAPALLVRCAPCCIPSSTHTLFRNSGRLLRTITPWKLSTFSSGSDSGPFVVTNLQPLGLSIADTRTPSHFFNISATVVTHVVSI